MKKLTDRQIDRLSPDRLEEIVAYFLGWRVEYDPNCDSGGLEVPEIYGYSQAFPPHSKTSTGGSPGPMELHEFQVVPKYSREPEHYDDLVQGLLEHGWTEIKYEYHVSGKRKMKIHQVIVMIEKDDSTSPLKSNYKWAFAGGRTKELALCRAIARAYMLEEFK